MLPRVPPWEVSRTIRKLASHEEIAAVAERLSRIGEAVR